MAIDTETKRRSVAGMVIMALAIAPVPDGTIAAVDREHILGIYAGIAPSSPGVATDNIHIFSTATVEPVHVSDSGDNLLIAGDVEVQGTGHFGSIEAHGDVNIANSLTVDTDTLVVDDVNHRVAVGTISPPHTVTIKSASDPVLSIGADAGNPALAAAVDLLEDADESFGTSGAFGFRLLLDGSANEFKLQSGAQTVIRDKITITRDVGSITLHGDTDVRGADSTNSLFFCTAFDGSAALNTRTANGTAASPTATVSGDFIFFSGGRGHTGSAFANASRMSIEGMATENWTASNQGCDMQLYTTPNGSTTRAARITIGQDGFVGINETAPETLLEMTSTAPYLTLHNNTEEDGDGGGESRIIFKREDGAGTETEAGRIEVSHDGSGANDQLAKMVFSTNTGSGIATAITIDSGADVAIANDLKVDTDVLVVDSTLDFVGIGIDPPVRKLHIFNGEFLINNTTTGSAAGDGLLIQQVGFVANIGNHETDSTAVLNLFTNSDDGIIIQQDGDIILNPTRGVTGIGTLSPSANADLTLEAGVLNFKETTTPTADTDYGKLYTKSNNELFFQDGAGVEHLLHGDAFSNIWFHNASTVEVTISTEDALTKIESFTVVGKQDDLSNLVGSTASNELAVSSIGGGEYEISFHASITATGGADKEMMIVMGIELATPFDITDVTDNTITPIVITSTSHPLENGDMVEIVGVLGNTAANGSFIVDNKAANTFEIVALDGTATTGNGDYNEGSPTGDVTIEYPGNMVVHREVRGSTLGAISATGLHDIANSDKLAVYVANLDGTTNLTVAAISFEAFRIGD